MDVKVPLPSESFTTDVTPLPSAPPPSYDDACATASNIYPAAHFSHQGTPLMTESLHQSAPAPSGNAGNLSYHPTQQVQVTPGVAAVRMLPVGRRPLKTTCPGCNQFINTRIRVSNRFGPTFWCLLLCITCVCLPCSCCPYFFCGEPLKVKHFCPRCNAFLGTYVHG